MTNVTVKRNFLRRSPRKMRVILNGLLNKKVTTVLDQLEYTNRTAAQDVFLLLKSAVAAAKQKNLAEDKLIITQVFANEGPTMKRRLLRSRGRSTVMKKSFSHITLSVGEAQAKVDTKKTKTIKTPEKKVKE